MLLLLLYTARHHIDLSPCANDSTALGDSTNTDNGGADPPKPRMRFAAVAGHSCSQCSKISSHPSQKGHCGEELLMMLMYAANLVQWPLRSCARRTASFLGRRILSLFPLNTAFVLSWLTGGSDIS